MGRWGAWPCAGRPLHRFCTSVPELDTPALRPGPCFGHEDLAHQREVLWPGQSMSHACLMVDTDLLGEYIESGVWIDEPGIPVHGSAADCPLGVGADPDGRMWPLHGAKRAGGLFQGKAVALIRDLLFAPETLEHSEPLVEDRRGHRPGQAERFVLDFAIPQSQPEDEAAMCDVIQGGSHIRKLDRILEWEKRERCPYLHLACLGGDAGQKDHLMWSYQGWGQEVLGVEHAREALLAGQPGLLQVFIQVGCHVGTDQVLPAQE